MIAAALHGRGMATEAAGAVLANAYSRYGISSVHAVVDAPNRASCRVLERLGFADRNACGYTAPTTWSCTRTRDEAGGGARRSDV